MLICCYRTKEEIHLMIEMSKNKVGEEKEFGGTIGSIGLIVFSHLIPFYLILSLKYSSGGIYYPLSLNELFNQFQEQCSPTWKSLLIYFSFYLIQIIFALILPGVQVQGLPIPSENNRQYVYNCNALLSWYLTLILILILHFTKIFPLTILVDQLGSLLCLSVLFSDILSLIIYFYAIHTKQTCRMSNSFIYDVFMGVWLNPRLSLFGREIDLKLLSEIRLSWLLLFLLSLSAALKQYEQFHVITWPMLFILFAQLLYVNACMKGEECIIVTWDIFYEKWGWMLIYWNLCGVPFVYSFHAHYILVNCQRTNQPDENSSSFLLIIMFICLCFCYYIWDCSLAQKINFRMKQRGIYIGRKGFPQMPWSILSNPRYLQTKVGDYLLIDGWWKYCRKPPYTADICMAFLWSLSCHQWIGILPYFYPIFFLLMILHRYTRDVKKCKQKYGQDWKIYCQRVPYIFLPGII